MEFIPETINNYCLAHTKEEDTLLHSINRDTHLRIMQPRMLSGHLQGSFLTMISHMIKPMHILEIGTYTGYSAICLAKGLQKEGKLITIDNNEELAPTIRKNISQASNAGQIEFINGNALEIIEQLNYKFDLVFIDADKSNYVNYYHAIYNKVNTGGYIVADNVLWSGKVCDEKEKDKDTEAIRLFNNIVQGDKNVENILIPLRDGLMMARKLL